MILTCDFMWIIKINVRCKIAKNAFQKLPLQLPTQFIYSVTYLKENNKKSFVEELTEPISIQMFRSVC